MSKWQMVPVEPTEEMWLAASKVLPGVFFLGRDAVSQIYRAMLAASPPPPDAKPTREEIARIIAPDWFHEYAQALNNYEGQHLRFQNDALERAEKILALFSNGELTK